MASNPYSTPAAEIQDLTLAQRKANSIPKSPRNIGIYFLVLVTVSILFDMFAIVSDPTKSTYFLTVKSLDIVMQFWLSFIAIQLLQYKDRGRRQYNYFLIVLTVIFFINAVYLAINPVGISSYKAMIVIWAIILVILALMYGIPWDYLRKPAVRASLH